MNNHVSFIFKEIDAFQMEMLKQENIPGVFKLEELEGQVVIDTTGYITMRSYLEHHTLSVKVFKTMFENFLSVMEDSLLYYLDWHNYRIDSEYIYISLDEQELKLIYQPIEDISDEACPIKKFLFGAIIPYAKFTRDESWTFFLKGVTALNTINHTYKSMDLLYDVFELRTSPVVVYDEPATEIATEQPIEVVQEKKKPWLALLSQITLKSKEKEVAPIPVDSIEATTILKKSAAYMRLKPLQNQFPVISIKDKDLIVGRNRNASDVVINNSNIGKIHAEIINENQLIYIRDLNSLNGTYINHKKISPYELEVIKDGDIVSFSEIEYRVEE